MLNARDHGEKKMKWIKTYQKLIFIKKKKVMFLFGGILEELFLFGFYWTILQLILIPPSLSLDIYTHQGKKIYVLFHLKNFRPTQCYWKFGSTGHKYYFSLLIVQKSILHAPIISKGLSAINALDIYLL